MSMSEKIKWALADMKDQNRSVKAYREARKVVPEGPVDLYRFENGKWSWAIPSSPIGQLLRATGEIYPTIKATVWFTVGENTTLLTRGSEICQK